MNNKRISPLLWEWVYAKIPISNSIVEYIKTAATLKGEAAVFVSTIFTVLISFSAAYNKIPLFRTSTNVASCGFLFIEMVCEVRCRSPPVPLVLLEFTKNRRNYYVLQKSRLHGSS